MLLRELCSVLNIVQLASPRETMKSKSPSWNSRSAESETVLDERTLGMMRDLGTTVGFCVGIATKGRPLQVQSVVGHLRRQTLQPAGIIVACTSVEDVGNLEEDDRLTIVKTRPGSARQRNAVLDRLPGGAEFVAFFDDDFYPHDDWLRVVYQAFRSDATLACVTGNVVADGICGPGLTHDDALRQLSSASPASYPWVTDGYSPYGCNMAFRLCAIEGMRFDERLVWYGWLEDRDFGARIAKRGGRLIKLGAATGVHLGIKSGRVSGRRLGYAQVMNPYYLHRKRSMTKSDALRQALKNIGANAAKSLWPEAYVDRRGRLLGNLIAIGEICAGRCNPEKAERL
jgi:GT2 family glycosyltransferase